MKTIGILNGPNLDRLGKREPEIYGSATQEDLQNELTAFAEKSGAAIRFEQRNSEGELIDLIAAWTDEGLDGLIVNLGAYTHTSIALRDCISASSLRVIEVHLSNIHAREEFRATSLTGAVCEGIISGLGFAGYRAAITYLLENER